MKPITTTLRHNHLLLLIAVTALLQGCERSPLSSPVARATANAQTNTALPPPVPNRTPIDTHGLYGNVYQRICQVGDNPFAVTGWDLDPNTRFLYFAGPFAAEESSDRESYPYLYMSIGSPERASVWTTLELTSLEREDLELFSKPGELQAFQLPHITAVPADPGKVEAQFGEPTVTRVLKNKDRTRLIYDRYLCFNGKLLAGIYFDIEDGVVVNAKGVDDRERIKWVVNGNRPPAPDSKATYYQDWMPPSDSAQETALKFVFHHESGTQASARELLSAQLPTWQVEEYTKPFIAGATIEFDTLTYRTTRRELDLVEVTVAFELDDGRHVTTHSQLYEEEAGWRITDWRIDQ